MCIRYYASSTPCKNLSYLGAWDRTQPVLCSRVYDSDAAVAEYIGNRNAVHKHNITRALEEDRATGTGNVQDFALFEWVAALVCMLSPLL